MNLKRAGDHKVFIESLKGKTKTILYDILFTTNNKLFSK